ncbi:hypothetical protein ACHAWF_016142 [Thalassiosira exigua]
MFVGYYFCFCIVAYAAVVGAGASSSVQIPSRSDALSALLRHHHRNLQKQQDSDTFSTLNSMLSTLTLKLPDAKVSRSGLDLTITQIECGDLGVSDVQISHAVTSDVAQRITLAVDGVIVSCDFRWEVGSFFASGSGTGSAASRPEASSVALDADFASIDFETHAPHDASIGRCAADLKIATLEVQDDGGAGLMSALSSVLDGVLKDTIEGELDNLICNELQSLGGEGGGKGSLDHMLDELSNKIDEYSGADEADGNQNLDPLDAERNVEIPTNEEGESLWVNFIELQDTIQGLAGMGLGEALESLLGSSPEGELKINSFLRGNVLGEDGFLSIDPSAFLSDDSSVLFELHDTFTHTTMSVESASVGGLDSFKLADLANPIGNHTLQNSLALEELTLKLNVWVVVKASTKPDALVAATADSPPLFESFVVDVTFRDVEIDFALLMGINTETLGGVSLGSVMHTKNILPCALGAMDRFEFTSLSVAVSDLVPPTLSGFRDPRMDKLITEGSEAMFAMYDSVLVRAMPGIFETTLREAMNGFVEEALDKTECPGPEDSLDGLVDYRDLLLPEEESVELGGRGGEQYGGLFQMLYGLVERATTSEGVSWLNAFVNPTIARFTEFELDDGGDLALPGDLFRQNLDVSLNGLNALIELGVSNVKISNLDSVGALQLLQPLKEESHVVNNTSKVGAGPDPIRIEMTVLVAGKGDKLEVHEEVELRLSLQDIGLMLEVLAQIQEPVFLDFPLQDMNNLHCWMNTIAAPILSKYGIREGEADTGLVLRKIAMAVVEARFSMSCISCSSPMMLELEQAMKSQEGVEDTTETINRVLNYAASLLGGKYVQTEIDRMVKEAGQRCPHSPTYQNTALEYEDLEPVQANEGDSQEFLIAILAVILGAAIFSTIVWSLTGCISRRRHARWVSTLTRPQKVDLARMQKEEKKIEQDLDKRLRSLVMSKEVPCLVRLFIPIIILGNIGLFLSGHLSLGGTVNISGSFAGQGFNVEGFFEFSMAKSTLEMWKAGARTLAILVALFSGLWPYTKLIATLLIWLAPPRWLPSKRRGKILRWLDVLGKWSMVDVFVLLMTLASFHISVESPDHLRFLPKDLYQIHMLVRPLWGLYANMLAQLVAQVLSHVIIHYHRKSVRAATKSQEIELNLARPLDDVEGRLCSHGFRLDYEASDKRAVLRRGVDWVLFAALVSFVILVICGCTLPSFSIEVHGIVGLVVESANKFKQAKSFYGVFDLAKMIMDQARHVGEFSDYIGMGTLASLLVTTVFLVPLLQAASLLAQWFAPVTTKRRWRNTQLNEILSAWQYMEVYVLSIVIAAWQLGSISEHMINAYCGELLDTFTALSHYEILDKKDAQCFRVDATVETASWLLVAASLLLFVLNHFVGTAASQKALDDSTPANKRLHTDRWIGSKLCLQSDSGEESAGTMDIDEEEGTVAQKHDFDEKVRVLPISPRFTDYYRFATTHQIEEQIHHDTDMTKTVETAVVGNV